MPIEFALRQRINLDRPAPRRRPGWMRLPPLALPVGAYWLALAGVFWALRSSSMSDAEEVTREPRRSPSAVDVPWAPQSVAPIPPTPLAANSPAMVAASPSISTPSEPAELKADAEELPDTLADAKSVIAQRAVASHDEPAPIRRSEPRPPEIRALTRSVSSSPGALPKEPPSEIPAALAYQELLEEARQEPRRDPSPPARRSSRDKSSESEPDTNLATSLPSCEAAAASANDSIDFGSTRGRGAPDITRDAFARVLENGAYLGGCSIPENVALEVCAAVQDGRVVGVSVVSEPRNAAINGCVRRAIAALRFPRSPRLDVTRTRFAPVAR